LNSTDELVWQVDIPEILEKNMKKVILSYFLSIVSAFSTKEN